MSTREVRYDEAIQLQQEGRIEEAVEKLCELVADEPDYALAHAALSVFYNKLESNDKAVEHGQKVCDLEPEDPFSFVAMSLICQKAGRMAEAENALAQARQAQMAAYEASNKPS
jgi:predicted Zn-dependent protease